jgi:hypothetical protein
MSVQADGTTSTAINNRKWFYKKTYLKWTVTSSPSVYNYM